jgi:hypothetical protein
MSEQKGHINLFSAKDIQRYLKGELSPGEMHAIEKAALDDPFLADAIDGMEETMNTHGGAVIDANLENIQQQVQNRVATKNSARIIAFRWWYAAAAVVVISGAIWLYEGSSNEPAKSSIAQSTKKNKTKADSSIINKGVAEGSYEKDKEKNVDSLRYLNLEKSVAIKTEPRRVKKSGKRIFYRNKGPRFRSTEDSSYLSYKDVAVSAKSKKDTLEYQSTYYTFSKDQNKKTEDLLKKIPGVEVSRSGIVTDRAAANQDSIETEMVQVKPAPKAAAANKEEKARLNNVISGRVVDQYDNAVSNASVLTLDDRVAHTTDQFGLFNIPTSDSLVHVAVSVSGYPAQNFTLQNNAMLNNIQLQLNQSFMHDQNADSRNKLDGYMKSTSTSNATQNAQPESGWVNFEQYLIKNKKPPPDNPNVKGQVIVSFNVNKKDSLSDFKIEQHLEKGYDAEAIRLIKEGPQWKLTKGRKAKVTVVVHF